MDLYKRRVSPRELAEAYTNKILPVRQILGLPPKTTKAEDFDSFEYNVELTVFELKTVIKRS